MLRVLVSAILGSLLSARLLHKSKVKMRVTQVPVPVQIPLQVPMLVPVGSPISEVGPLVSQMASMPSMSLMLNEGPGPEVDEPSLPGMDMEMDSPFASGMFRGFAMSPGFETPDTVLTPGQLINANEGTEHNTVAQSSSTSVSRQQMVETLKNGTRQLRTVETHCKNGKCQKKESVRLIKPTKELNAKAKAAHSEQKTVPAANVGPSTADTTLTAGPPSIEDVLHQVMGFGSEIGNADAVPRFPFAAEGLRIKMPRGSGAPAAPLSLQHLDDQDQILGTLPKGMNGSDLKVDQSGHVVTVQYRMHTGQSKVGVEQRFSLDFTPDQKPKAKYSKASGKFSVVIPRPKNAQRSSSDVEIVIDDEGEPTAVKMPSVPAKQATHSLKRKHQKHMSKETEDLENAKKHIEAALDPKAEPIIMLEFSS